MWRFLSALILLFWAVMTGLIIRDTYFPDQSRFAAVPPRFVFDLFLAEAAAFNNSLHLYKGEEKIGQTNFSIRREEGNPGRPVYAVLASGSMDLPASSRPGGRQDVSFRLVAELVNAEEWTALDMDISSPAAGMDAEIRWKEGESAPDFRVKKDGRTLVDSSTLSSFMAVQGALGGRSGLLSQAARLQDAGSGSSPLTAREGLMELAGKRRRCYVVTLKVLGSEEVRMLFTEAGELARIDLPQGYRFIEPMMHGLEKGIRLTD